LPGTQRHHILRQLWKARGPARIAMTDYEISNDEQPAEIAELRAELGRLKEEHRDLDIAIAALEEMGTGDQLQIQRLKKRKLVLKDRIIYVEDRLTPDIIA
jgi:hypothetical protein